MNELDLIKLNIYEAFDNGEITYDEREYLLEQVDAVYEDARAIAKTAPKTKASKLAKYYAGQVADDVKGFGQNIVGDFKGIGGDIASAPGRAAARIKGIPGAIKSAPGRAADYAYNHPVKAAGKLAVGGAAIYGLSKGAVALKKKYDASVNGLLRQKSKLETKLKNTSDLKEKLAIMKEIKAIEIKVKQLEKASDKQLKRAVKESTFDYLLESINDLYYDDVDYMEDVDDMYEYYEDVDDMYEYDEDYDY